jgi:hypothetical protein
MKISAYRSHYSYLSATRRVFSLSKVRMWGEVSIVDLVLGANHRLGGP